MACQQYENIYRSKKEMILNNFLGGIAWGIVSTVGLAIVLALLGLLLRNIDVIPFVGNFVAQITHYVNHH